MTNTLAAVIAIGQYDEVNYLETVNFTLATVIANPLRMKT